MHIAIHQINFDSILLWGFVASIVVTIIMQASQGLGITRMSLPFMLGTIFSANRDRSQIVGFFSHLLVGWFLAFIYAAAFESWQWVTWWLGMAIGLVHGSFALVLVIPVLPHVHPRMANEFEGPTVTRMLEPPGFMALNYGRRTPIVAVIAHLAFGAILGGFYRLAGS
ncbi:MAG: hypothetical protein AAGU11_19250 [Syntrophobacteraceae bacterium]